MQSNEALARKLKRQMNGFSNKPLAAPIAALAIVPPPKKAPPGPKTWSTALEVCRKAMGWSIKEFIAQAFKGDPNVQPNDVRRWEAARATPSIAQCQKIRTALPAIYDYDDLLPLDRRALTKPTVIAHPIPVQLEGWPGPKVATFGEAIKWCRLNAGQSQPDLGLILGCQQSVISSWERGRATVLIKEMYLRCVEVYPALDYAPKPEFSSKFKNIIRKRGYLESENARVEASRYQRELNEAEEARRPKPVAPPPPPKALNVDRLNQFGAAYGVAKARLMGLRAEEGNIKRKHEDELTALGKRQEVEMLTMRGKIADAEQEVKDAEARVDQEALDVHGRAP